MSSAESPGKGGQPLDYVLVRHMARSPRTRTMRAARSGHRRQGVMLDDGTRIRKKGRKRFTEVTLSKFADNHDRLLEYLRVGAIEVCDPVTERPLSYDDVVARVEGKAPLPTPAPEATQPSPPAPAEDPVQPKEGYTEEDLLNMGFDDLKHLAVNVFGVPADGVKKLRAKQAVVDLIMEVATSASEE